MKNEKKINEKKGWRIDLRSVIPRLLAWQEGAGDMEGANQGDGVVGEVETDIAQAAFFFL